MPFGMPSGGVISKLGPENLVFRGTSIATDRSAQELPRESVWQVLAGGSSIVDAGLKPKTIDRIP